jgi:hypothetical protein
MKRARMPGLPVFDHGSRLRAGRDRLAGRYRAEHEGIAPAAPLNGGYRATA